LPVSINMYNIRILVKSDLFLCKLFKYLENLSVKREINYYYDWFIVQYDSGVTFVKVL